MPVTSSTQRPVSGNPSIPPSPNSQPAAQRHVPASNWNESSLNTGFIENSCFSYISQCLERFAQWIKGLIPNLFGADKVESKALTIQRVSSEQLNKRIRVGREWIEYGLGLVIKNTHPDQHLEKFLVEISYKGVKVFCYPTSDPAVIEQVRNDAMVKLEELIRSPQHAVDDSSKGANLKVCTHFFRRSTSMDRGISPVFYDSEGCFEDFIQGSRGITACTLTRIQVDRLKEWVSSSFLPESAPDREGVINYVASVINA